MEEQYAIEVNEVSKYFKVYADKGTTAKEKILFFRRNRYEKKNVLKNVSFKIKKGESVGLIGHNGCGKSTTLKLLTRIMYPDEGNIVVRGRVSSLLELGAGFHPDMTGTENIYINASIFGLTKKEIDEKLDQIIEFAELGEYINNPVRTYSSGMYMRLAFAVAINVNADILLIDEILAVGDVNFQSKCINRLFELKKQGITIVLVSHSAEQIELICDRSIWIDSGKIKADGKSRDVHKQYLKFMGMQRKESEENVKEEENENIKKKTEKNEESKLEQPQKKLKDHGTDVEYRDRMRGNGQAKIYYIESYDENGKEKHVFETGNNIEFKIKYKVYQPGVNAWFGLSVFRNDGFRCYGTNTKIEEIEPVELSKNGEFSVVFPNIQLLQGKYYVDVCIGTQEDEMLDYLDSVNEFEIYNTSGEMGICRMENTWKF